MLRTDGPNRDDSDSPLRGLYNLTVEEETVIEDAYWDAVAMFGRTCPVCERSLWPSSRPRLLSGLVPSRGVAAAAVDVGRAGRRGACPG